jgi:tRNA nucleotidyltransferase (CCA-adding enzyme)
MVSKLRVVSSFLNEREAGAAFKVPDEIKSKEELTRQTNAVEKLVKDTIVSEFPSYKDKVYSTGGFVRDRLLGRNPKDLDLVIDDPEQGMKAAEVFAKKLTQALGITTPNNPHPLKEAFGIWGVVLLNPHQDHAESNRQAYITDGVDVTGYVIEITPPRKEGPYDEMKRAPSRVDYTSLEDDSRRRDLTINALYQNIVTGEVKDFVGGIQDIQNKKLKPPEHPEGIQKIYEEDPLRIMRLIRFEGKLPDFKIDPQTKETIKQFVNSPEGHKNISSRLSKERIRDELEQILVFPDSNKVIQGLNLMKELGFLKYLSPEFDKLLTVYHDKVFHKGESVWDHTMEVMSKTPPTLKARLAALFHDVGKIATKTEKVDKEGRQRVQFIGHEKASAALTEKIMRELTFDSKTINSVKNIVHSHMGFKDFEGQKPSTQQRTMRIYIEKLHDDLDDAIAILKADAKDQAGIKKVENLEAKIKKLVEEDKKNGLLIKRDKYEYVPPLSGDEIRDQYGIDKEALGAVIARLKKLMMEGRMGDPDISKRKEEAKKLIESILKDKNAFEALIKSSAEDRKSGDFFKIRNSSVRNVLSSYFG